MPVPPHVRTVLVQATLELLPPSIRESLISDPALRRRMGEAARVRSLAYSWDAAMGGLLPPSSPAGRWVSRGRGRPRRRPPTRQTL